MFNPSFYLDLTSGVADSRVNFFRSTSASNPATYFDSNGLLALASNNQPRFDYDSATLLCKGLLIEEARTNLLLQSQNYADSNWVKSLTVDQNTAVGPDGTLNAATCTTPSATNIGMFRVHAVTAGQTYTFSFFVKLGTMSSSEFKFAIYDASNLAFIASDIAPSQALSSTSYVCVTYTFTAPAGCSFVRVYPYRNSANVGVKTFFLGGSQSELGSFATSYIPTTTAALTRNADVATITGTAFSDWWQASKGGVLVRARPGAVSGVRPWVQFDDNTVDNIIALRGNATNPELYIVDGGTPQAQIDAGTIAANTDYSLTGWWETNDCKARLDSGAVVTDISATIPTVTQARLGSDGTNYLNGHLTSISYYDTFSGQIYTRRKNKAVFNLM